MGESKRRKEQLGDQYGQAIPEVYAVDHHGDLDLYYLGDCLLDYLAVYWPWVRLVGSGRLGDQSSWFEDLMAAEFTTLAKKSYRGFPSPLHTR